MTLDYKKIVHYFFATVLSFFVVYNFFEKSGASCKMNFNNFLIVLFSGIFLAVGENYAIKKYININQSIYLVVLFIFLTAVALCLWAYYLIKLVCF
jgi:hypothetical protein